MTDPIDQILAATRPEQVFGSFESLARPGHPELAPETVGDIWHTLSRAVHPDRNSDPRANEAMVHLNALAMAAKTALAAGTYGTGATVISPVVIQTRRHAYKITDLVAQGDCCNVYDATYTDDDGEHQGLVKIVRDRRNGDLVTNEAKVLKTLLSDTDLYDYFSPFLPPYKEAFGYRSGTDKRPRQGIAFGPRLPNLYTLRQVHERYPEGVDPRDAAWMIRRIFVALGYTQSLGYVHGAVLPEHVLIHPEWHGLVLIDWKYSVPTGQSMIAIPSDRREFYPPEVTEGKPVTTATDLYMAARCMSYLMATRTPPPLRAFIWGTAKSQQSRRPQDAFDLKDEFDELIERMWGPRRFRPFSMT